MFHLDGGQFRLARLVLIKGVPGRLALSHAGKILVAPEFGAGAVQFMPTEAPWRDLPNPPCTPP